MLRAFRVPIVQAAKGMATPVELRDEFNDTLVHIRGAFSKIRANSGLHQVLSFPDLHKLTEGLFLSAWTHWEVLCRNLLIADLTTDVNGVLRKDVTTFKTKRAPHRLAERMLNHPDHPERFIEWNDYRFVKSRGDEFLGTGHRFVALGALENDLAMMKRVRNAIAHKSDKAWDSFRSLVSGPPFNLAPQQLKGITPGRFLSSHQWGGKTVLETATDRLESCAITLVP